MIRMRKTARTRIASAQVTGAKIAGVLRRSRSALLCGTALQAAAMLVLLVPARAQPLPNARRNRDVTNR